MKLQTSIPTRRDGTFKLHGLDGVDYVFKADESGDVVCEIADEKTIIHLLSNRADFFWPASEEDYREADRILDGADVDADLDPPGSDGGGNDDDDDPVLPPGADPLAEANTPPAVAPGKGARVKKEPAAKKSPAAKKAPKASA